MKLDDYIISCLSEEAGETVKECMKIHRFGLDSNFKGGQKNRDNLFNEIIDFIAVAEMLAEKGIIEDIHSPEALLKKEEKKDKVEHYIKVSRDLGRVE